MKFLRSKENELKQQLAALQAANETDLCWEDLKNQVACMARDMKSAISNAVQEIEPGGDS
jgi:hypothetical protein